MACRLLLRSGALRTRGMKRQRCVHVSVRLADVLSGIEQLLKPLDRKMLSHGGVRGEHVEKRLPFADRRLRCALDQMMRVEPADAVAEREHHRFAENQAMRDV